jgi:hypothetical protein
MLSRFFSKNREVPLSMAETVYLNHLRDALELAINYRSIAEVRRYYLTNHHGEPVEILMEKTLDTLKQDYKEFENSVRKVAHPSPPAEALEEIHIHAMPFLRSMLSVLEMYLGSYVHYLLDNDKEGKRLRDESVSWGQTVVDLRENFLFALYVLRRTHPALYNGLDISKQSLKKLHGS